MKSFFKLSLAVVMLLWGIAAEAFDIRALHIDLRAEVMTIDALKEQAKKAAVGGINTIIMEWEGTFPFQINSTICNDEAYTREEIKDFINHCANLGIEVIPLQNCFGHCEYILRHERYAALREDRYDYSQVCPCNMTLAKEVFKSIFSEIAEMHPSKYIHIGGDETRLLGRCQKCSAKVAGEGKSALFCDYVLAMCEVVKELGKTPVIWGDILTAYPEAASRLPKEMVLLDWNYGWDANYFGDFKGIMRAEFNMWGAPSLRSYPDDIHDTQWMKHFDNLKNYVSYIRDLGFKGVVETSWSTSGAFGYIRSGQDETIDIQPIRYVYPLSGFDILLEAYYEASSSDKPFEPEEFIRRYCRETFGFDETGVQMMWEYFNLPQTVFSTKNCKDIPAELVATEDLQKRLSTLKPKKGKDEFAHLVLMMDIRVNYLKFADVRFIYESPDFKASMKDELSAELKSAIKECNSLRKRFCKLNKDYLKNPERAFGEWGYVGDMENIYRRLINGL